MNRVLRVACIQFTSWPMAFGWPMLILALSFVLNWAFYTSMGDQLTTGPSLPMVWRASTSPSWRYVYR